MDRDQLYQYMNYILDVEAEEEETGEIVVPEPFVPTYEDNSIVVFERPIEEYLRTYQYISVPQNNNNCPICLQQIQVREDISIIDNCSHEFHHMCLINWLNRNRTCPICRYELNFGSSKLRIINYFH